MRLALVALCVASCATARPLPALPPVAPAADIERMLPPPAEAPDIPDHIPRYDDVRVRKGGCPGLQAGILVSPATYALRLYALTDRMRLIAEARTLRQLRIDEREATLALEQACQARSAELEQAVAAERQTTTWKYVAALVTGGLVMFAATLAGRKATR